jgi:hypothetical protein
MGRLLVQTSMGIKSHQMDALTSTRGRGTPEACTGEKEGNSPRDTLVGLDLGGSFPYTMTLALEGP